MAEQTEQKTKQKEQAKPKKESRQQGQQEFEQSVLDIARVSRVVSGGRRFSFRSVVAVGNRNGRVGVGVAKGADVALSIDKAARKARKSAMNVPMTPEKSIPYSVIGKQSGSEVFLKPSSAGRGIIAGGPVRVVCDLAGYKDITAKILSRSTNKLNISLATLNALQKIRYTPPKEGKKSKVKDPASAEASAGRQKSNIKG